MKPPAPFSQDASGDSSLTRKARRRMSLASSSIVRPVNTECTRRFRKILSSRSGITKSGMVRSLRVAENDAHGMLAAVICQRDLRPRLHHAIDRHLADAALDAVRVLDDDPIGRLLV